MTTSKGPPGPRGNKKRPAPTIDLQATEVASEPVGPESPASQAASIASDVPPPKEPEPEREPERRAPIQQAQETRAEPPPEQPASSSDDQPRRPAIAWLPPDFSWPLAAAGSAGVVVTLLVLAMAGVFTSRDGGTATVDTRLARMEQQVREIAARPAPPSTDPRAVDDLANRLGRLETVVATPRPPVTDPALANRLAMLEGEIRALGERIGVVARRGDEVASIAADARKRADAAATALADLPKAPAVPRAEIDALAKRVAALELASKTLETQLGRNGGGQANDPALRMLAVAAALNSAIDRGSPYAAELGAAKAVAADPKALAPLDGFATSGVPSVEALARELAALLPALAKAVGTAPAEGGILDRLKANAEKIVRVRPIDEAAGDDPAAGIRRIEVRLAQRDLAGAVAELAKLPADSRARASEWVAKVEARDAAINASRRFAAAALTAIAKPSL